MLPVNDIMSLRNSGDKRVSLSAMLALNCASVLKGSKAAAIVTVEIQDFFVIRDMLRNTGVLFRLLNTGRSRFILYMYREKLLFEYMCREDVGRFLERYGYGGACPEEMLDRLADRMVLYGSGKIKFPHEIGIFLGYPVADVRGFIENEGKNFIYSGYWKVYENADETMELFRQYDREREAAVTEVIRGIGIGA